jgi:hypothetical protein
MYLGPSEPGESTGCVLQVDVPSLTNRSRSHYHIAHLCRPTQIDALINQLDELTTFLDRLSLLRPEESHRAILTWSRTGKVPGSQVERNSNQGNAEEGTVSRTIEEAGIGSVLADVDGRLSDGSRYPAYKRLRLDRSRSPEKRAQTGIDGQSISVKFTSDGQSGENVEVLDRRASLSFAR